MYDRREAMHQTRLTDQFTAYAPTYAQTLETLRHLGISAAQAPAMVARQMVGQAYLLAADDLFWISGWIALSMIAVVWVARRPKAPSGPVAAD